MSEFVGRTGANRVYSYPEGPRGAGVTPPTFARNFASGPTDDTLIADDPGSQVPWAAVDVGTPGVDVQITPQSTGILLITGVICVKNTSTDPEVVSGLQVVVQVNGVDLTVPFFEAVTVDIGAGVAIPILTQTDTPLTVGVLANVQILLIAGDSTSITLREGSSSLEVQEVPASTG